jgi:hypothetical protein
MSISASESCLTFTDTVLFAYTLTGGNYWNAITVSLVIQSMQDTYISITGKTLSEVSTPTVSSMTS